MKDEQPATLRHAQSSSTKSEFDFIASLRQRVTASALKNDSLVAGIGDDAAVFRSSTGKETVITADLLAEDIDFRRTTTAPFLLGHKALAVSLSAIVAMEARRWGSLIWIVCLKMFGKRSL